MLNIKKARIEKKISQAKLSELSNVNQSVIAEIETGKTKNPTVDTALRLAKALGCSVEELTVSYGKAM